MRDELHRKVSKTLRADRPTVWRAECGQVGFSFMRGFLVELSLIEAMNAAQKQ